MPRYYTYLISSLPTLHFDMPPPFSFERFFQICQESIPEREVDILRRVSAESQEYNYKIAGAATLKKWHVFDTALRNELVKIRASRKRLDPLKYLRADGYTQLAITHIAMNAYKNPSILESEKALAQARWRVLDELATGHYFDLDFLIVYTLKLAILLRWESVRTADKQRLLEEVLQNN